MEAPGSSSSSAAGHAGQYERVTPIEHILRRPDMYVGSCKPMTEQVWCLTRLKKEKPVAVSTAICDVTTSSSVPPAAVSESSSQGAAASSEAGGQTSAVSQWAVEKVSRTYTPALCKIFDEILVNAADNRVRSAAAPGRLRACMTRIDITVDRATGEISVRNDGLGIPVEVHPKERLYVPELIFGTLLTSSNYDDSIAKTTGGRNGYGAKLTNVLSTRFSVETQWGGKRLSMAWADHMTRVDQPVQVTSTPLGQNGRHGDDFTLIRFTPDLALMGLTSLTRDVIAMMRRRALDVAACTGLLVTFNGVKMPAANLADLIRLYPRTTLEKSDLASPSALDTGSEAAAEPLDQRVIHFRTSSGWEIAVRPRRGHLSTSYVNTVATPSGGTHARMVTNAVVDTIVGVAPDGAEMRRLVRNMLHVAVHAAVVNPAFSSQTKERLVTPESEVAQHTPFALPQRFVSELRKLGLLDLAKAAPVQAGFAVPRLRRESTLLEHSSNGATAAAGAAPVVLMNTKQRSTRRLDVAKLEDATRAGLVGSDCTIILTEGDSAKAFALAGLGVLGRERYGVFPLRGKTLNVRNVSLRRVAANEELSTLARVMGLQIGHAGNVRRLRYNRVLIMADQDEDGAHVKGLVLNFFDALWPELARTPGFISQFVTPLVKMIPKATGGSSGEVGRGDVVAPEVAKPLQFYSMAEFERFHAAMEASGEARRYIVKYYKGLGSSTSAEAREYFRNFAQHNIEFSFSDREKNSGGDGGNVLELPFGSLRADDRKEWLLRASLPSHSLNGNSKPSAAAEPSRKPTPESPSPSIPDTTRVGVGTFVHTDLAAYSISNCLRALPSAVDGLKRTQRKVLYTAFRRRLGTPTKVVQLSGMVLEDAAYHHGEASLHSTIVNLAQDFVGAGNVPLLAAHGQFGTRHMAGADHASARYIYTCVSPLARLLFPAADDPVLEYRVDDGAAVEPTVYAPIVPLLLLNGCVGIGTGFACNVPCFSPFDVTAAVRAAIDAGSTEATQPPSLTPWYFGFRGTVTPTSESRETFSVEGLMQLVEETVDATRIRVDELPPNITTDRFKANLSALAADGRVVDFIESHTVSTVCFDIVFNRSATAQALTSRGMSSEPVTTPDFASDPAKAHAFWRDMLGLRAEVRTNLLYAFAADGSLVHFKSVGEIIAAHVTARRAVYERRKAHEERRLAARVQRLRSQLRFARLVASGELRLDQLTSSDIAARLSRRKFPTEQQLTELMNGATATGGMAMAADAAAMDTTAVPSVSADTVAGAEYRYLLSMPLRTLSADAIEALTASVAAAEAAHAAHKALTIEAMWHADLTTFEAGLRSYYAGREREITAEVSEKEAGGSEAKGAGRRRRQRKPQSMPPSTVDPDTPSSSSATSRDIPSPAGQEVIMPMSSACVAITPEILCVMGDAKLASSAAQAAWMRMSAGAPAMVSALYRRQPSMFPLLAESPSLSTMRQRVTASAGTICASLLRKLF